MNYIVRLLKLYKNLYFYNKNSTNNIQDLHSINKNETLTIYQSGVSHKNLEALLDKHLLNKSFFGYSITEKEYDILSTNTKNACTHTISTGNYLFTQGIYKDFNEMLIATEKLWLESLWRDLIFENQTIFIRTLYEDEKQVFQVFRQISTNTAIEMY